MTKNNFYNINGKSNFIKNERINYKELKSEREYLLHLINIKINKLTNDIVDIKNINNEVYEISKKIKEIDKKLFFFIEN